MQRAEANKEESRPSSMVKKRIASVHSGLRPDVRRKARSAPLGRSVDGFARARPSAAVVA
jgi:hypothetical protein